MKPSLAEIAAPGHTALVTQGMSGCGRRARHRARGTGRRSPTRGGPNIARLLPVARNAGIPTDYSDAILDNTLSLLATITTTDELIDTWK